MRVDMHTHSVCSDGTDEVTDLAKKVKESGIAIFSLTDHDTIAGDLLLLKNPIAGVRFIPGIEFSCKTEIRKCHILGYGYDISEEKFNRTIEKGKSLREKKLSFRLDVLKERGITFSEEEKSYLFSLQSCGKPHISHLLVKRGLCSSIQDGIEKYLSNFPKIEDKISAKEAVSGILSAGGIPVWAHPLGGEGERHLTESEFEEQFSLLRHCGIRGLECYYSRYNREEVDFLCRRAEDCGLLISGGSDYHGKNKNIPLGTLNDYGAEVEAEQLSILRALI